MEVMVGIWAEGPIAKCPGVNVVNGMNPANFNTVNQASRIQSLEALIKENEELMRCLTETQSRLKTRLHQVEASKKRGHATALPSPSGFGIEQASGGR